VTSRQQAPHARALRGFRRRVDAFFGSAHVADLATAAVPLATLPPSTTKGALTSRLADVLARLETEPASEVFTLRKSLTMHDGRLVSVTGDSTPLAADENVRIVTTSTTLLDVHGMRVETNVLVFERTEQR
jgi:hypothetical protein